VDTIRAWQRSARRFFDFYGTPPRATALLIGVFVVVHAMTGLADWRAGTPLWLAVFGDRSPEVLVRFGARSTAEVRDGAVWRLLACGFLHADLTHLFFNALAFWGLGRLAEAVFGPVRFLWLFIVSVIGGSLLSQWGGGPLSVGASGGVFGLMGGLVVFGWRRRKAMPPPLREVFGRQLWPWIVLNLGIGAMLPFIDNHAHVGGLLTGAATGLLLQDRVTWRDEPRGGTWLAMAVTSAVLLAVTGAAALVSVLRG
jgi:membrane associated rhomboid family serine protease